MESFFNEGHEFNTGNDIKKILEEKNEGEQYKLLKKLITGKRVAGESYYLIFNEAFNDVQSYFNFVQYSLNQNFFTFPTLADPALGAQLGFVEGHGVRVWIEERGKSVPNSLQLNNSIGKNVIVTGPNNQGKTTFLRMAAQLLLLAQAGLPVPALAMKFTPLNIIGHKIVGDDASTASGLLVSQARHVWQNVVKPAESGGPNLILLDEILPGTHPKIRTAIETAVLRRLEKTNSLVLIATHNWGTTALAETMPDQFRNYHVDRFRVKKGAMQDMDSMEKAALEVLDQAGWDQGLVDDVRRLLK